MAVIACRGCDEPDCTGCNMYILERALKAGKLDRLKDSHGTIAVVADVRPVVRGRWVPIESPMGVEAFGYKETMVDVLACSACEYRVDVSEGDYNYCPNCGADMREG